MPESFDLVVLGTGQGGSAPAMKCRRAGWSVAVVDDQPYGGTCALRGCDPKRVLAGAAELIAWNRRMRGSGIKGDAALDWPELMAFKNGFTTPVPEASEKAFAKEGIATLHGAARFVAPNLLAVGERELLAQHVVVATGAGPRPLGIPGEELIISSTEFLELPALPRRIVFVGAGYVSLEFAHIVARAGAEAVIVGRDRPLHSFDETLVDRLLAHTKSIGVELHLGSEVTAVERAGGSSRLRVHSTRHDNGTALVHDADLVVHGAGRVPNTAHLGLAAGDVRLDQRGGIQVNEYLQSVSNPRVYAAGDAVLPNDKRPLTPNAAHEGLVVASNLLHGNQRRPDYRGTPSIVFTVPPLASAGLTEAAARAGGMDVRVESGDTGDWYSNRRVREPAGMFKTIVDAATDHIVGAHLLGTNAEEVINVFALAMRFGIAARDVKHMAYAYPTAGSDLPSML